MQSGGVVLPDGNRENLYFYVNPQVISDEVRAYLESLGVSIRPYNDIYADVKELKDHTVLLEKSRVNFAIYESVQAQNQIIDQMNPTVYAKTQKNATEIENMKKAHIIDGVVMTKYIYWLKKNIGKIPMDECSVADRLDQMRREHGALDISFNTISAYGKMRHCAITMPCRSTVQACRQEVCIWWIPADSITREPPISPAPSPWGRSRMKKKSITPWF